MDQPHGLEALQSSNSTMAVQSLLAKPGQAERKNNARRENSHKKDAANAHHSASAWACSPEGWEFAGRLPSFQIIAVVILNQPLFARAKEEVHRGASRRGQLVRMSFLETLFANAASGELPEESAAADEVAAYEVPPGELGMPLYRPKSSLITARSSARSNERRFPREFEQKIDAVNLSKGIGHT